MTYLLSLLYRIGVEARWLLFRWGVLPIRRLRFPVISVGNLTVGGTGKTPFVAYLAKAVQQLHYQPIILSRGYRGQREKDGAIVSDGKEVLLEPVASGDEPHMLARRLPGIPVVVGRDRYRAGRSVEDRFENSIHLLDDGFQHLALSRDLNILLIDGTDPFGGGYLLPRGRLREPLRAISRADMVIITRAHLATRTEEIERTVRTHHPTVPIGYFYHDATGLRDLATGTPFPVRDLTGHDVVALAAIGNPDVFLRDLAHYQIYVLDQFFFRDHHVFRQHELDEVLERTRTLGARNVVTTEKDAVRLSPLQFEEGELLVFEIEARPEDRDEYMKIWKQELEDLLIAARGGA